MGIFFPRWFFDISQHHFFLATFNYYFFLHYIIFNIHKDKGHQWILEKQTKTAVSGIHSMLLRSRVEILLHNPNRKVVFERLNQEKNTP